MRYIIFVIDDQSSSADGGEMAAIDDFNEMLEQNGHWIYAAGIGQPGSATLIDNRSDLDSVVSGSAFPAQENYRGFWLIKADSDEQALDLAKQGSKACNRKVELRPFLGQ
jgi:hypothetical protein